MLLIPAIDLKDGKCVRLRQGRMDDDTVFSDNIASRITAYSDGGGAYLWSLNHGSRIESTVFISNTAPMTGGEGGGLTIHFGGDVTIDRTRFQANQAAGAGGILGLSNDQK